LANIASLEERSSKVGDSRREKNWLEEMLKYANDQSFDRVRSVAKNMSDMILLKHIFFKFADNGIFETLGIPLIPQGGKYHSFVRPLLAYLYWQLYESAKESISLYQLLQAFPGKSDEVRKYPCKLSIAMENEDDAEKSYAIRNWGELIVVHKGIKKVNALTLQEAIYTKNEEEQMRIHLQLSPIGKCFVEFASIQFEYFSARILDLAETPLSLYDVEPANQSSTGFEDIINEVIDALRQLAESLQNTVSMHTCQGCENDCRKIKCIANCRASILRNELYSAIRESINYVDRFRCVLFCRFEDQSANETLLNKIKELNALYDIGRPTDEHPMRCDRKHIQPYYRHKWTSFQFNEKVDKIISKMKEDPDYSYKRLFDLLGGV
jgi:hypothetical protein